MTALEPISPAEALAMYEDDIDGDLSPNTVYHYMSQLDYFRRWCEGEDADEPRVTDMTELTGRDLTRYFNWRSDGINKVTLRTNYSTVKGFLRFCVTIDAVDPALPEKVDPPKLEHGENRRESLLTPEQAQSIIEYYDRFHYASLDHALIATQWHTGVRMSALHSLDLDDLDTEDRLLHVEHRPDQGTRLKNGHDGDRHVAIDERLTGLLEDYIEHKRTPVTDEYGREPLFTSPNGRLDKSNLNRRVYAVTTPCQHGQECPAGKDPHECEYTGAYQRLMKCPHNVRPHDVRRGAITTLLREDVPKVVVSDRTDVSPKTLDKHYDQRSSTEQAQQRREYLEDQ